MNNFAQGLLGGMIVQQRQLQKNVADTLGYLPEQLKDPEEGSEPWAITFAKRQPISVAFDDNGFTVTIRGTRYTKGDGNYPGMNITVAYDLKQDEQGPRAVRRGDLEILPPGFKPDSGQQLSTREQVLRRMLQRPIRAGLSSGDHSEAGQPEIGDGQAWHSRGPGVALC